MPAYWQVTDPGKAGAAARSGAKATAEAPGSDESHELLSLEAELRRLSLGRYKPREMRLRRRPKAARAGEAVRQPPDTASQLLRETPGISWREDGQAEPCGRVSVVCPTLDSRQDFHKTMYACFDAQDWPDKELVVVETQRTEASPFFKEKAKEDDRIVFVSWKIAKGDEDMSIGLKRNIGLHLASGEWVATCDDDDLYAPTYLRAMLGEMLRQQAVAITLGSWFVFEESSGRCGFVDPRGMDMKESTKLTWGGKVTRVTTRDRDEWLYGFGFSYVYSRSRAVTLPYPDKDLGEDFDFFMRLKERKCTAVLFDEYGLCLHTLHSRSTSSCEAKELPRDEILDLDVAALGVVLAEYLGRKWMNRGMSRCFTTGDTRKPRVVTVNSSQGPIEVNRPPHCTALDVRKAVAPQLGVQQVDVALFASAEWWQGEQALADTAAVTLRMAQLWAVLPIDLTGPEEVPVLCVDAMDEEVSVEVRVMSSVRMADLRDALLKQHLSSTPKGRLRRLRIAKRVGNSFVGVDEKLPLGEVRQVHVIGLADALGAGGA